MKIKAVIFDLDGVICFTDEYHYLAWKRVADEIGVYFDRAINDRLRGVSRMESLDIILEKCTEKISLENKNALAERKNSYYKNMLVQMNETDLDPKVKATLDELRERGYLLAIGSSSKNTRLILERIGLSNYFDAISDGNDIKNSKPDPEVFLRAAEKLSLDPEQCIVVEDAVAGALAASRANMKCVCLGDAARKEAGDYNLQELPRILNILPPRREKHFLDVANGIKIPIFHRNVVAKDKNLTMKNGDVKVIDLGEHLVGKVKLQFKYKGARPDAPVWLKLRFAERMCEFDEDPNEYKGFVSPAWIQQEQIYIDELPTALELARRYVFRFIRIEVASLSGRCDLVLESVACYSISSADELNLEAADCPGADLNLIDRISCNTLRDCMQEVFEDGPKRDRRMWLGDLRIQALVNYETYKNIELVKKSLYLFAACTLEDGRIPSSLYISPKIESDGASSFDYSLLFVPTLLDYYNATNDIDTLRDLWDIAVDQIRIASSKFDERNVLIAPEEMGWSFIDWSFALDRQTSSQGVYLYCVNAAKEIAKALGDEPTYSWLSEEYDLKSNAALNYLFDKSSGMFISGGSRQISFASQIWMVLAGVVSGDQAKQALINAENDMNTVKMVTPYLVHHYVQAWINIGDLAKASEIIKNYWGGMIAQGADTFWEMFDPEEPNIAPYGGTIVNSYCHAWSCGPAYFIRKYKNIK